MRSFLIALALVASASPAAAQPEPWQPERLDAGWIFMPAVAFGAVWDDNATLVQEGNPPSEEVVGLVSPRGEISFIGKRTKFSAGYAGTLERYRTLSALDRYAQSGRLKATYMLTPRLSVSVRQSVRLTPTTDEIEIAGLPYARVGTRQADSGGGFRYDLSRRTAIEATYAFQWVEFVRGTASDEFVTLLGGHYHNPGVTLVHRLASRLTIGAGWDYSAADLDGGAQIYRVHSALGQASWQVTQTTSVNGALGVAALHAVRSDQSRTGPSYKLGVEHRFPVAIVSAKYDRSYVPAFGFGGLVSSEGWSADVNVPLMRNRMFASAGVASHHTDPLGFGVTSISLDSTRTNVVVGYAVARWLRVEGFFTGRHQTSSARGQVDRNRIGIQFVTLKPMRIE